MTLIDQITPEIYENATNGQKRVIDAVRDSGSLREAAKAAGVSKTYIIRAMKKAIARKPKEKAQVVRPVISSCDLPIEDLIKANCERVTKRIEHEKQKDWMPFEIRSNEPCMVVFVGDPHVDDNQCNWPQLLRDIDVMRSKNVYSINLGDIVNNWVGKLMSKYADAHVTRADGWRLAEWFINDSGVNWLVHLLGNHDVWNDGKQILKGILGKHAVADDWRVKFRLVFPDGYEVKIDASHDHKGHSQYNALHGQKKVTLFEGSDADIIIGGHKHNWALSVEENPHTNNIVWYARARGYKLSFDAYDKRGQWGNQWGGASIAAVIDPRTETVQCFADLKMAEHFLDTLIRI